MFERWTTALEALGTTERTNRPRDTGATSARMVGNNTVSDLKGGTVHFSWCLHWGKYAEMLAKFARHLRAKTQRGKTKVCMWTTRDWQILNSAKRADYVLLMATKTSDERAEETRRKETAVENCEASCRIDTTYLTTDVAYFSICLFFLQLGRQVAKRGSDTRNFVLNLSRNGVAL